LRKQVDADHYNFRKYVSKSRWSSFYHQADEILSFNPGSVLEVGVGTGLLGAILRQVGLKYESMDIADDLGADHVGSVTEMPFADESFDVVGCFEVLEHIEFALFRKALSELCRVAKDAVILSVPDALSVWPYSFWIPKVGPKRVLLRRPFTRKREHVFDGEHYWEINKGGYEFDDVVAEVAEQAEESGYQLCRTYRVWENPYHRFFVLRRHSPSL